MVAISIALRTCGLFNVRKRIRPRSLRNTVSSAMTASCSNPQTIEHQVHDLIAHALPPETADSPIALRPDLAEHKDQISGQLRGHRAKLTVLDAARHNVSEYPDVTVHVVDDTLASLRVQRFCFAIHQIYEIPEAVEPFEVCINCRTQCLARRSARAGGFGDPLHDLV